jgi:hypothetical protein
MSTDLPPFRRCTRVDFAEAAPSAPAVQQLVSNAAFVTVEKKALLVGGYCQGESTAQVLVYDPLVKQWLPGACPLPNKLSEAAAVVCGTTAVLFGGWNDTKVLGDTMLLQAPAGSDPRTLQWEPVAFEEDAPQPPARRMHGMTAYTAADGTERAYVFGGFGERGRLNDLWEFDAAAATWRCVEAQGFLPSPRDSASLVADAANGRLLLFGGFTNSRVNDLFTFDVDTATWVRVPVNAGPTPRFGCFGAVSGGYALFGMGQDANGPSSAVHQLALADLKWSAAAFEGDELDPLVHFSAAPSDGAKRLLVYGGTTEKRYGSTMFELEFEKLEPVVQPKGGKK